MPIVHNTTGVPHFCFEQAGPEGERLDVLVVRATFDFADKGEVMTLARVQQPIAVGDAHAGRVEHDPMRAVLVEDGDLVPCKPGTDILVFGSAIAPGGKPSATWQASLRVGNVQKTVQVHGPRKMHKRLFGWKLGPAEPVTHVPLDYRLAFGGCIDIPAELSADGAPTCLRFAGNPAGCGWLPGPAAFKHLPKAARTHVKQWVKRQKEIVAPQFDSVSSPFRHSTEEQPVQGFGPIARWWEPRVSKQGTYDEHWRNVRYPLLPEDFDARYNQSAPADMICTPHLAGDEGIDLVGFMPEKRELLLPGWKLLAVVTRASGDSAITFLVLDTVRLHLDSHQASLVWRAHFGDNDPVVNIALAATTAAIEREDAAIVANTGDGTWQ